MTESYAKKLKDPRWQRKRLEIMQRDGWTCQGCGDERNTLHVHHRLYEIGREPWQYENDFLVTLCGKCHEDEHGEDKKNFIADISEMLCEKFIYTDLEEFKYIINLISGNKKLLCDEINFSLRDPVFVEFILGTWKNLDDPKYTDIKYVETADCNILVVNKHRKEHSKGA